MIDIKLTFGDEIANAFILPHCESCPFCGNEDQDDLNRTVNILGHVRVKCGMCGAIGPDGRDKEDAIHKWNKRGDAMEYEPSHVDGSSFTTKRVNKGKNG